MKILCVDDDPVARAIYTRGLGEALSDDEISEAASGDQAIGYLEDNVVDVVITDLSMPGLSGLDVLREAKEKDPSIEVIMVTGKASIASAVEAMHGGARDYIEKPIDIPLLREKLENIREFHRRSREAEDLRAAKEVYEEQASREVRLLELRLQKMESAVADALDAIEGKDETELEDRLQRAVDILKAAS